MFLVFSSTSAGACLASFLAIATVTDTRHRLYPHMLERKPKGPGGDPLSSLWHAAQRAAASLAAAVAAVYDRIRHPHRRAGFEAASGDDTEVRHFCESLSKARLSLHAGQAHN